MGEYLIKDLGYPEEIVEETNPGLFLPIAEKLKKIMPSRKPARSKFDHGVVSMLCGSKGMGGSAALAANAAMRAGCGMVHLNIPEGVATALSAACLEIVMHGIAETATGRPSLEAFQAVLSSMESAQSVCIGPGISHETETAELTRALVSTVTKPVILDADGINAYKNRVEDRSAAVLRCLLPRIRGSGSDFSARFPSLQLTRWKPLKRKRGSMN